MKKTLSIFCVACAVVLAVSCGSDDSDITPTIFEVNPAELTWEWNDTKAQTVMVSANYGWTAKVSDETKWTLAPATDGKTLSIAPKAENSTGASLTATVIITYSEMTKIVKLTQAGDPYNGHQYVDLGLSVMWATCNVGATSETDYGSYFAWGETTEKAYYTWDTYKWGIYNGVAPDYGMTKYKQTDGIVTLEAGDDPATANWGGKWRTPTLDEIKELIDNCNWTWTTKKDANGIDVKGIIAKSKSNGNSIFLPTAGFVYGTVFSVGQYGNYWSSTVQGTNNAHAFFLDDFYAYPSMGFNSRDVGQSVRAVIAK